MKNIKLIVLFTLLVGFFCFRFTVFAQTTTIKLNYSHHFPAPHVINKLANEWAKEIEKRTNGKISITVFPGATLMPPDKAYDGVLKGIGDIAIAVPAFTRGRFPLTEVLDLPLGYKSAISATKLTNEYFDRFKPKEFSDVQIMYSFAHGVPLLHSKKSAYKFEDFKGLKVRCTGLAAKIVNAIGATPVAMPVSEAYDALSRGIVDASFAPWEAAKGWKWAEVTKFGIESPAYGYTTTFVVVINKSKWNAIPPEIQNIILKVNEEWAERTGNEWEKIDKEGKDFAVKIGNKVITLPKEENDKIEKSVKPILDDYIKMTSGKGLPGEEALKFCLEQLKKFQ